jgi:sarcosine oxidase subunit alpha
MTFVDFEGNRVPVESGDTIASALYRAGVRIFSRSMKFHRPRGLYCLTGDCPNCLITVDAEPGVRACVTPALSGQVIKRENAWPSADRDVLALLWNLRSILPVGFYYKTFLRPRWAWSHVEPLIRRVAGLGRVSLDRSPADRERFHHHTDLFVAGGGIAGLSAALAASEAGQTVVLADEGTPGEKLPAGPLKDRVEALVSKLRAREGVTLLERAAAIGVYEGLIVPVVGEDFLHLVHPQRVVVATGAIEQHCGFHGNDVVGVWLGRGAARLVGAHGLLPGRRAVVVATLDEGLDTAEILRSHGVELGAVVVPESLVGGTPAGVLTITDGEVVSVRGRHRVEGVVVESPRGIEEIACDALVLSRGLVPRDGLLRQAAGLPVTGAGDAILPGCSVDTAAKSGQQSALGQAGLSPLESLPTPPRGGFVCLCEDVRAEDVDLAWFEGFHSTELLKRYTTATMGPCQGALCGAHLRALVRARGGDDTVSAATTARPPARAMRVQDAAAGVCHVVELNTALHQRHLELGAKMEWAGSWRRPESYGDPLAEYWAVRRGVSIMDVGTLGKFIVTGRDATDFLDRLYPRPVRDLEEGQGRYSVLLNEAGYVLDDGLICSLAASRYYVTLTSGGAAHGEAWLRDWADLWRHQVHIANQTDTYGAINVAGPRACELLMRLSPEFTNGRRVEFMRHREIEIAGVSCLVVRLGFVGEPSFELHHTGSESVLLWNALLEAGADLALRPHGLEALRLLRLEKGHIIIGQDTDFDSTPRKLGLDWIVSMEKADFVGKPALQRIDHLPLAVKLVSLTFEGDAPPEGANVDVGGRTIGHLTSSRFSPVLGHGIALGWIRRVNGEFPTVVSVDGRRGTLTSGPFYDPEGVRLRA